MCVGYNGVIPGSVPRLGRSYGLGSFNFNFIYKENACH